MSWANIKLCISNFASKFRQHMTEYVIRKLESCCVERVFVPIDVTQKSTYLPGDDGRLRMSYWVCVHLINEREEVQEYACLGWRNNYFINMHTHTNQLTKWKCSTWFRCEMNYEDKSSTIATSFVVWFEASLSPDTQSGSEAKKMDLVRSITISTEDLRSHIQMQYFHLLYCFEFESFQFHSLTGRSLFERCLVQWGCSEDDSAAQDVERFCSHILALGILQPFSDCIREPPTGSDVTDKPIFNVWLSNYCLLLYKWTDLPTCTHFA